MFDFQHDSLQLSLVLAVVGKHPEADSVICHQTDKGLHTPQVKSGWAPG